MFRLWIARLAPGEREGTVKLSSAELESVHLVSFLRQRVYLAR
jgi:hypothetical protein